MSKYQDPDYIHKLFEKMKNASMVEYPATLSSISKIKPKSIIRILLQTYIDDPAWAFAGDGDEEDRMINTLRKANIFLTMRYEGRKIIMEIELR